MQLGVWSKVAFLIYLIFWARVGDWSQLMESLEDLHEAW